jgi:hypothetical protein
MIRRRLLAIITFLACTAAAGWSQEAVGNRTADNDTSRLPVITVVITPDDKPAPEKNEPIQDNSFLVEEAYNQERGVVQHINTFMRLANSKDWAYTFTQEWPWNAHPRHQFSYTLAATSTGSIGHAGIGDTILNYRYQLVGSGETRLAISPRISALLPTGDSRFGRGTGGAGVQTNLPVSFAISRHFVAHTNAGFTLVPRAQDTAGDHAGTAGYNLGQSLIWLARSNFNVMFEGVYSSFDCVTGPKATDRERTLYLSPGVRWAHNFKNGLQIVPGVAVPIGAGPSQGEHGLFFYLSFEHPFIHLTQSAK